MIADAAIMYEEYIYLPIAIFGNDIAESEASISTVNSVYELTLPCQYVRYI